jgi:hypothetical protein
MKRCPFSSALAVIATMLAALWVGPSLAQEPLSSWNDTAPKAAIVGFIERVTSDGFSAAGPVCRTARAGAA